MPSLYIINIIFWPWAIQVTSYRVLISFLLLALVHDPFMHGSLLHTRTTLGGM